MVNPFTITNLNHYPELQTALVRMGIWLAAFVHIMTSQFLGHLTGNFDYFLWVLALTLPIFSGILLSALIRPVWPARQLFALAIDVTAITAVSLPADTAINPFSLLYLWIVVSYGARYGKRHLVYASVGSVLAYTGLAMINGWMFREPTETTFFLIFLIVLPMYQYIIVSARIAAEQATEVKNRFLSTMTHELRTPLSGVIGMSRLLESTRLDERQREYVESIQTASGMLMSLIGDILDLSKIEAKHLKVDKTLFDIRECLGAVCHTLRPRAEEKHLEFICTTDDDVPPHLFSDENRVKQILFNLIGNAIKFTEQGRVEVRMSILRRSSARRSSRLRIVVTDTGPGIPADKLKRVFEGFWQENTSVTRRYGGTGLGTTISRELARILGGDVDVSSAFNSGSSFRLLLPLETPTRLPDPAPARTVPPDDPPGPSERNTASPPGTASILVAEDDPINAKLITTLLGKSGHHTTLVDNGEAALQRLSEQRFDLAILDVRMPKLDGIEVTRRLRAQEKPGEDRLPLVALTASATSDVKEACLSAGMDEYLLKPIDPDVLHNLISRVMKDSDAQKLYIDNIGKY